MCGGRALNQTKRVDSWSVDDAINFQALVLLEGADRSPRRRAERAGDCTAVVTEFLKSALNIHDHLVVGAFNGSAGNVGHSIKGAYGSLTLNSDGSYVYTANKGSLPSQIVAQDKFTYTASDGHGGTDVFLVFA